MNNEVINFNKCLFRRSDFKKKKKTLSRLQINLYLGKMISVNTQDYFIVRNIFQGLLSRIC